MEQEKVGKLRVWTEGGRLYQEESDMIQLYGEQMKRKNSYICYWHSKAYCFYFDGNNITITFLNPRNKSVLLNVNLVNAFVLLLEKKKTLTITEKKGYHKDNYYEELAKLIFGEALQFQKEIEGDTGSIIPILAPFGNLLDCRFRIWAECAGYEFEYMEYLNISASAWDRKIHHWAFTGDCLIIHGVQTPKRFCFSRVWLWENMKPFGFTERQNRGKLYIWTDGREASQQDVDLAHKYCHWVTETCLSSDHGYEYLGYFDGNSLNLFFRDPENLEPFIIIFEDIRQALQTLRIQEREEV